MLNFARNIVSGSPKLMQTMKDNKLRTNEKQ